MSMIGLSGTALFDIVTAPVSAARCNKKQAQLSPAMNLHDRSLGLALRFSFNRTRPIGTGFVSGYTPSVPHFPRQEKRKSGVSAFMLSLGATVGPILLSVAVEEEGKGIEAAWLLLTGGLVFGPSVGHWYAEQAGRGWLTVGLRALFVVLFIVELDNLSLSN